MKVGMIGLGKLGLPVATAMAYRGATVYGYDTDPRRMSPGPKPELERGPDNTGSYSEQLREVFDQGRLHFVDIPTMVCVTDLVFIAVQTPHQPEYEGITPVPPRRVDFDYRHLVGAVSNVVNEAVSQRKNIIIAIISTCLPGTMRREIMPLLNQYVSLVYNPYFIAMGTTMHDFLHPEAVLIGTDDASEIIVRQFYHFIGVGPMQTMGIESAELAKVAYNTWISSKLAIVNTLGEICHKTEADVDEVTCFLKNATDRIVSDKYMDAGMGDSGGCHPRDNIAMSWLANNLDIHYDWFSAIIAEREAHAKWLAKTMITYANQHDLKMVILGYAYKPKTSLTIGSHALLVKHMIENCERPIPLQSKVWLEDRHVSDEMAPGPAVYLIGCKHNEYAQRRFPAGSVVLDPWRYIEDQDGVAVIRIGEGRR